jgi:hypothetical protein
MLFRFEGELIIIINVTKFTSENNEIFFYKIVIKQRQRLVNVINSIPKQYFKVVIKCVLNIQDVSEFDRQTFRADLI